MEKCDIDFKIITENFSLYKLDDGSLLKAKIVLVRLIREKEDPDGNPLFGFIATNVLGVIPPKEPDMDILKKQDEDVGFKIEREEWNEYKVDDTIKVMIKPVLVQVMRTGNLDPRGDPIYNVNIQPIMRINKGK